jgi:hypothetical protein
MDWDPVPRRLWIRTAAEEGQLIRRSIGRGASAVRIWSRSRTLNKLSNHRIPEASATELTDWFYTNFGLDF